MLAISTVQTVGLSVFAFTGIILILVALLLVAKGYLIPDTLVTILINGDDEKKQIVSPGASLLTALSGKGIFIPSACGGGGTCAQCKCKVTAGGGDVLATETGHLTMKEQKDNWRLACQVKVKNDMEIEVDPEIFGVKKFEATVISNHNVATFIKEFILELPEDMHFESGGYIQIEIPKYEIDYTAFDIEDEYKGDWDKFNLWKYKAKNTEEGLERAYSMANHPAEGAIVMLNVRIASPPPRNDSVPPGIASSYIFNCKPGDKVTVSGPFGEFFIRHTDNEMVYIGGGAGMAPLRSHLYHLFHTLKTGRKVSYWYGARSLREVFYQEEFEAIEKEFPNFTFHLALSNPLPEDNWEGFTGFIHQVLKDEYLLDHEAPEDVEYYTCGPPMMLNAIKGMLWDLGVPDENLDFDDFGG
jgi:Na+-transporting NADH:ubiquinone oxidoreductase subunit F